MFNLLKENLEDFPKPERSSFGSVTYKDVVYIAGGHQGPEHTYPKGSFLNIFQAYDIKSKTWATLPSMNEAKHGFQMAAFNNFIYVFGGFTFSPDHKPMWKSVDTIERFDIQAGQWQTLNVKLPRARSSNALAVIDDKVYLIGGWDSTPKFENDKEGRFHPEIDVFDLTTETLTTINTQLPQPLRRAFTAVAYQNEIYLLGGIGEGASHFDWIDNLTVFNPKAKTWQEMSPLPFATFAPGAGVIDDQIFLIGGMILRNLNTFYLDYVDDIYSFDLRKNKWQHSGVYLNQNKGFPQVVPLSDDELGILGGHTYIFSPQGIQDHPVSQFESLKLTNK
jgi:N-acetylneuraminic acid mutarotase